MKKIIVIFFAITIQHVFAQESTLISFGEYSSGGFGALVLKFNTFSLQ